MSNDTAVVYGVTRDSDDEWNSNKKYGTVSKEEMIKIIEKDLQMLKEPLDNFTPEQRIKRQKQLQLIEDALVIYRLTRCPKM